MGKSRLAAEVIRSARQSGLTCLAGECQSYGTTSSYLVWQGVWRGFFDLDPVLSLEAQVASLKIPGTGMAVTTDLVDDIADACLFFSSEASRWVTGMNLPVDGGRTAMQ